MRFIPNATAAVLAAGFLLAAPATATVFVFDINGTFTSKFQIDSSLPPDRTNTQLGGLLTQISFENRTIKFNGVDRTASIFFGDGLASKFQLQGPGLGFIQFGGPTVFSGPLNAPVFTTGRFQFRNGFFNQAITLDISPAVAAVPEPASWAMLITGFGLIGAAARRRRGLMPA